MNSLLPILHHQLLLFRSQQVDLPPGVEHLLLEELGPLLVHLLHEAARPVRLQRDHVLHGQLVRLLAQRHVGAVPAGVLPVLLPRVVLRLPPVKLLKIFIHL